MPILPVVTGVATEARSRPGETRIWWVRLRCAEARIAQLRRTLSADEASRADRFRRSGDRDAFIVARAALREVLAGHLGDVAPGDLVFRYGPYGKPALSGCRSAPHFNLSHAGDLAVIALDSGWPVGVDIEQLRDIPELTDIVETHFAPRERKALLALPADQRNRGFFRCWTCKEAVLKSAGLGIGMDLTRLDVWSGDLPLPQTFDARILRGGALEPWSLRALAPDAGYVATLCVQRRETTLRQFNWN